MAKKNMMGMSAHLASEDKDWRAEDDLRVLMAADEIKEDKARMNAVRALAKEKLLDLASISVMKDEKPEANDKD